MPSAETVTEVPPPGLQFIPADKLDPRSDEEIASWLQQRHPVTSEKNIWTFWNTGFTNAAPWVQRNMINWVRRMGPEWTVHCLDYVEGSETHARNYLKDSWLPEAFIQGTMDGPYAGTHQADLIRLPLIWEYGGVWVDAGFYLFRHMDDICWRDIEDPTTPYQLGGFLMKLRLGVHTFLNSFIAGRRHDPFIKRWHDVFLTVWGTSTNCNDSHKHPLISHLPLANPPLEEWNGPPLAAPLGPFTDYLGHVQSFERVRSLVDPNDGFDGHEYFTKRMRFGDGGPDIYLLQMLTAWDGEKQHELLSRKRTGEGVVKDAAWQESEDLVNKLLATSSTLKLSHGGGGLTKTLAAIWDSEEFRDGDNIKDSFGEYLRYGSVHFDQLRKVPPVQPILGDSKLFHIGYLDPVPLENEAVETASS